MGCAGDLTNVEQLSAGQRELVASLSQRLGAIRKLVIDTLTSAALEGVYADLRALLKTILTEGKALEAEYQNLRSQATQQP